MRTRWMVLALDFVLLAIWRGGTDADVGIAQERKAVVVKRGVGAAERRALRGAAISDAGDGVGRGDCDARGVRRARLAGWREIGTPTT